MWTSPNSSLPCAFVVLARAQGRDAISGAFEMTRAELPAGCLGSDEVRKSMQPDG